ncbi:MAG: signal peptidase I [Alphaproteobacteria bacterium]|nr:MAG: signal peptidase I [Alphaproteobacteria bacterium]
MTDNFENGAESEWMELVKTAFFAVLLAMTIRATIVEPFNIPSGSMKPTLLVGDYLFVSKYSYGYSQYSFPLALPLFKGRKWGEEPKRGDVVVFKLPSDNKTDYIKRVVGLPGDTVQMRNGRLYLNGTIVPRTFVQQSGVTDRYGKMARLTEYDETLPNGVVHKIYEQSDAGPLDNTRVFTVPAGHYFAMGDNRDNSQDSRVTHLVGAIPFENLVGRAEFLFFSTNGEAHLWEFWKWPWTVRYERLFNGIE